MNLLKNINDFLELEYSLHFEVLRSHSTHDIYNEI